MSRPDPETAAALKAHEKIVAEYRDAFRSAPQIERWDGRAAERIAATLVEGRRFD